MIGVSISPLGESASPAGEPGLRNGHAIPPALERFDPIDCALLLCHARP